MREPTRRAPFARRLPIPLPIKNGPTLATIADARSYILKLPPGLAERSYWQHAMQLMLDGASPEEIGRALKLALFYDAKLDLERME